MRKGILLTAFALVIASGQALADEPAQEQRLDRGDRIEARLDHKGDRIERRLDRAGDRVDRRLDRRGHRIDRRFDRRIDRPMRSRS